MLLRICVPNRFQFRMMQDFRHFLFHPGSDIHYIGGAEILPEPLDSQAEAECIRKLRNEQDETARNTLVEHNLRLVVYIAKKFDNTGVGVEDLISIGTIGLIKAISTYKEDYGSRLATYAARCIDNELLMHFRSKKKTAREVSLYEPIGTDKEGNQIHLLDIVESDEPDVVETIETDRRTREVLALVPKLLSGRERYIIENRYGLYACKPMTQREIAAVLGISRSYVSRIEKRALEKLRKGMESAGGGR